MFKYSPPVDLLTIVSTLTALALSRIRKNNMKRLTLLLMGLVLVLLSGPCWGGISLTNGYWQMGFSTTGGDINSEFCGTVNEGVYTASFDTLTCDLAHWQCHGIAPDCTGGGSTYTHDYIFNCDINHSSGGNCNTSPTKVGGGLTTSADRTGSGGNGWRTYRGPCIDHTNYSCPAGPDGIYHGTNDNGRLVITFAAEQRPSEFWIRFYQRYEAGFDFNQGPRGYKHAYFFAINNDPHPVNSMYKNIWWLVVLKYPHAGVQSSTKSWVSMFRTGSDGLFHSYEYHLKMDSAPGAKDGVYEFWVDGINVSSRSDIGYRDSSNQNNDKWDHIWIPLNGGYWNGVVAGTQHAGYIDYDDIAIALPSYTGFCVDSASRPMIGQIGCSATTPPPAGYGRKKFLNKIFHR